MMKPYTKEIMLDIDRWYLLKSRIEMWEEEIEEVEGVLNKAEKVGAGLQNATNEFQKWVNRLDQYMYEGIKHIEMVDKMMEDLDQREIESVEHRHFYKTSHADIATQFCVSVDGSKRIYSKALEKMWKKKESLKNDIKR